MKNIKCFSLHEIIKMQGIDKTDLDTAYRTFKQYNVEVFQPHYFKATNGPTKRPKQYVTSNKQFTEWVKRQNLIAILKGLPIAKPKYKKYEKQL